MAAAAGDTNSISGLLKKKEGHRSAMTRTKWTTKWVSCDGHHIMYWTSEQKASSTAPKKRIALQGADFGVEPSRFEIVLTWNFEDQDSKAQTYTLDFRCADDEDYRKWEDFFEGALGKAKVLERRESIMTSPIKRMSLLGSPRRSSMASRPSSFSQSTGAEDDEDDTDSGDEAPPDAEKEAEMAAQKEREKAAAARERARKVAEEEAVAKKAAAEKAAAEKAAKEREAKERAKKKQREEERKLQELNDKIDRENSMATRLQAARRRKAAVQEVDKKRRVRAEMKAIQDKAAAKLAKEVAEQAKFDEQLRIVAPGLLRFKGERDLSLGVYSVPPKSDGSSAKHRPTVLHSGWLYKDGKYLGDVCQRFFVLQNTRPGAIEFSWYESDVLKARGRGRRGADKNSVITVAPQGVVDMTASQVEVQPGDGKKGQLGDDIRFGFALKSRAGSAQDPIQVALSSEKVDDRKNWMLAMNFAAEALASKEQWLRTQDGPAERPWASPEKKKKRVRANDLKERFSSRSPSRTPSPRSSRSPTQSPDISRNNSISSLSSRDDSPSRPATPDSQATDASHRSAALLKARLSKRLTALSSTPAGKKGQIPASDSKESI